MKILIIIVFFKNSSDLKNLLEDLKKLDVDICVVNNGEKKDVEFVRKFKNVEVIQNEKNVGFAKAVNLALKFAGRHGGRPLQKYEWIWLLNPDCRVEIEWKNNKSLDPRLRGDDRERGGNDKIEFDIFSPVVYDEKGKVWFWGGKIDRWTGEVVSETKGKSLDSRLRGNDTTTWVSGCGMFVDPKVFKKIGFFDERFFLFYEDVDFCLRARKEGFRIGMIEEEELWGVGGLGSVGRLGGIRVIHRVSGSVNQVGLKKKYEIESTSKWLFLRKHWREFLPSAFVVSWLRNVKHKFARIIAN